MIKRYFLRDLHSEIKKYEFPLSYATVFQEQCHELYEEFGSSVSKVYQLDAECPDVRTMIARFNYWTHCIDPRIVRFRFATEKFIRSCCLRKFFVEGEYLEVYENMIIAFNFDDFEPQRRVLTLACYYRELYYWLENFRGLHSQIEQHNFLILTHDSASRLQNTYPPELQAVDRVFKDLGHLVRRLVPDDLVNLPKLYKAPWRAEFYIDTDEKFVDFLSEGPQFFRHFFTMSGLRAWCSLQNLDNAILALFSSSASYGVPEGETLKGLVTELLTWGPYERPYGSLIVGPTTFPSVLGTYSSVKMSTYKRKEINFNDNDWCAALNELYEYLGHSLLECDECYWPECTEVDQVELSAEAFVEEQIQAIHEGIALLPVDRWIQGMPANERP